jgi:hypothetical protein
MLTAPPAAAENAPCSPAISAAAAAATAVAAICHLSTVKIGLPNARRKGGEV